VPKVEHPVRFAPYKARAIDYIRFSIKNRPQQLRIFFWVIFKVSILDKDNIPSGDSKACVQRSPFAFVDGVIGNLNCLVIFECQQIVTRSVGRTVIDDHDFAMYRQLNRQYFVNEGGNRVRLVKAWNHNAYFHGLLS
jgi:hypothetical protein